MGEIKRKATKELHMEVENSKKKEQERKNM